VKLARQKFNVKNTEIAIVGDRMATDIKMAHKYKMKSVLTLSGVTQKADIKKFPHKPDIIINSVADFKDNKIFAKLLK